MAPVKITFNDHSATPPIYVAGSFTDWQPVEIEPTKDADGYIYEKTFDLTPGTYQYKFRLGPGDWWVCDTSSPSTLDASGHENNEIVVEAVPEPEVQADSKPETVVSAKAAAPVANEVDHEIVEVAQPVTKSTFAAVHTQVTEDHPAVTVNGTAKTAIDSKEAPAIVEPESHVDKPIGKIIHPANVEEKSETARAPVEKSEVVSQPVQATVNGGSAPKPATKESDSKGTSVSSIAPENKAANNHQDEPEKLNWFARIFLCGGSRNVILAAAVVSIPVLMAYVIQK